MSAVLVQPKDGPSSGGLGPFHGQSDPILDRSILGLAHSPQIALLDRMLKVDLVGVLVPNHHNTLFLDLKSLIMRTILLGFLCHQANVGHVAHGRHIKLSLRLHVRDHFLVHCRIRSVRDETLGVLQLTIAIPHLSTVADDNWHGGINDDIGGDVQVGDSLVTIDHREPGSVLVTGIEIGLDGSGLVGGEFLLDGIQN